MPKAQVPEIHNAGPPQQLQEQRRREQGREAAGPGISESLSRRFIYWGFSRLRLGLRGTVFESEGPCV